jgi:hypothetical protein
MSLLPKLVFILIAVVAQVRPNIGCKHLFPKDYLLFLYRETNETQEIEVKDFKMKNGDVATGIITTSICGDFDVPSICSDSGKAKMVFVSSEKKCEVISKDTENWEFSIDNKSGNSQEIKMKQTSSEEKNYLVAYTFICSPQDLFEKFNAIYSDENKTVDVQIIGGKSCGYSISFLKSLSGHPKITGGIFLALGILLCFFGLKFYKDMLMFFIPTMIAILCFYLYLTIVVKNVEMNNQYLAIFAILFILIVIIALAVMFTNAVYFLIGILKSFSRQLRLWNICAQTPPATFPFFPRELYRIYCCRFVFRCVRLLLSFSQRLFHHFLHFSDGSFFPCDRRVIPRRNGVRLFV